MNEVFKLFMYYLAVVSLLHLKKEMNVDVV